MSWTPSRRSFPAATRRLILRRDPVCALCGERPSVEADHVVPHAEATLLGWTPAEIDAPSNGQGACRPCHVAKTREEQRRGRERMLARARHPSTREAHPGLTRP